MSNAYEFVKEMISKPKLSKEEKLAKLDEFMKTLMEVYNKNYPDWHIGTAIIFGNRYDKLEVADEGGAVSIYKNCDEFHAWLRTKYPHVPHYFKAKNLFFEDGEYSQKFFNFYRHMYPHDSEDNAVFLEEVVERWKKKYDRMTEVDLFLKVKTLRIYLKQKTSGHSHYGVATQPMISQDKAMKDLLDIFYYCIYYKYDLYLSLCNPNLIEYKITSDDIEAYSYMYGQTGHLTVCVFEGNEAYYYNEHPILKNCFPEGLYSPPDDFVNYKFPLPTEYIAYCGDGDNEFRKSYYEVGPEKQPTIEDAVKVFDIGLYDFPNMNLSGGDGIAVTFKRVGPPDLVQLEDRYCDETWE